MKRTMVSSIEVLGIVGGLIWGSTILLRVLRLSDNYFYVLYLGLAPNWGAAWITTMIGKWLWTNGLKRVYGVKTHICTCLIIIAFGFASEIVHDKFLNSPFDIYDMVTTVIAQVVMMLVPIMIKDKCFAEHT